MTQVVPKLAQEEPVSQREQKLVWLQFAIGAVTLVICAVAAFVIYPSFHKAKQAEITQAATAVRAESSLAALSSSTLQRIQQLDAQSNALTTSEVPELYFWKGGLQKSTLSSEAVAQLSRILIERRFLIGDSAPLLNYSLPLKNYVCGHFWFVIATSPGNVEDTRRALLSLRQRDPRFTTAETIDSGPNNPANGIAIGFLLLRRTQWH